MLVALFALTGCTHPSTQSPARPPQPSPVTQTNRPAHALLLIQTTGYLDFPLALQAAKEAQITPEFRQKIVVHFTQLRSQFHPLLESILKDSRPIDRTSPLVQSIETMVTDSDQKHLKTDPQFEEFNHRLEIIKSQVGLLMNRPLALEKGFGTLGIDQAQAQKLHYILHQTNTEAQSFPTDAGKDENVFDRREQFLFDALSNRGALRAILTPNQNTKWDSGPSHTAHHR